VAHALYPVPQHLKTGAAARNCSATRMQGSVLIFTRTEAPGQAHRPQLEKAGYKAASLQGNLSQNKRQEALDGFRSGKYQILVATDIAARGIDVSSISHVINYDIRIRWTPTRTASAARAGRPRPATPLPSSPMRMRSWSGASSGCWVRRSAAAR